MTGLLTPAELAVELGITEELLREYHRTYDWPCVRFSNKTIRYRPEHVDQILAMHEDGGQPDQPLPATVSNLRLKQTSRSKARTGT